MSMDSSENDGAWPPAHTAWYVVALLTIAYALAILDRVSIGLLIAPLQETFDINDTQFGLLQGLAFSLFYSLLGLPLGMLCDRWRRVVILSFGLALWSIATIACGFAQSFTQLFIARVFVGVGEAALVPCAASLIADYFRPATRPKAYGVFVSGSSLGTAMAMILGGTFVVFAGYLIASYEVFSSFQPWQIVFILCGAPGLVFAAILILTVREPARQDYKSEGSGFSIRPIAQLFAAHPKALLSLMMGTVLNLTCVYAIIGWFPALFIRIHHWSAAETGWLLGAVGLPISIFAAMNSGLVISWLTKRGHQDAPMLAAMASGLAMVVFATTASLVSSAALALFLYALNSFFVNWNISAVYSGIAQIVPNELRGQVMALHSIASGLLALTAGNLIVGSLSDYVFTWPTGLSWALAALFFFVGLGAIAVLATGRGAFRRAAQAASRADAS